MKKNKPDTVDAYIASFPPQTQQLLQQIRSIIQKAAPQAVEKISYNMPGYYVNGYLVWFAAYKKHIGLYPSSSGITAFEHELGKYVYSKGAIQFPLDKPLPVRLITKIVKYRMNINANKQK